MLNEVHDDDDDDVEDGDENDDDDVDDDDSLKHAKLNPFPLPTHFTIGYPRPTPDAHVRPNLTRSRSLSPFSHYFCSLLLIHVRSCSFAPILAQSRPPSPVFARSRPFFSAFVRSRALSLSCLAWM